MAWLYRHDASLKLPYPDNLNELIHEPTFKAAVGEAKRCRRWTSRNWNESWRKAGWPTRSTCRRPRLNATDWACSFGRGEPTAATAGASALFAHQRQHERKNLCYNIVAGLAGELSTTHFPIQALDLI